MPEAPWSAWGAASPLPCSAARRRPWHGRSQGARSSRPCCASALSGCNPATPRFTTTSAGAWPNSGIKKAATLRSITSKPRTSKATKKTIASLRRARSTCSWRSATSARCAPRSRLRTADRSCFWPSIFDPLAKGYVANLSRPGGNATGIFVRQLELAAKRVEIAREAFPRATILGIAYDATSREQRDAAAEAARKLGLEPRMIEVKGDAGYGGAFGAMDDARSQPIILPAGPMFFRDRAAIAQALLERRLPSIAAFREKAEAGALISYGFDLMGMFYDIASYVHQIARGAKPSDMPIEQSPRFYMAVNLKAAAALGVSLSDVFVARANEVIE